MSELDDIYQDVILDHNKTPRNFKKLDNPTHYLEGYNPLCGDQFKLYLDVDEDQVVLREVVEERPRCRARWTAAKRT